MNRCRINIAIIEDSDIIYEGLTSIILHNSTHIQLYRANDLDDLLILSKQKQINIVILNPSFLQNRQKQFLKLRQSHESIIWIAILYSFYHSDIMSFFDHIFNITDSPAHITQTINAIGNKNCECDKKSVSEELSEREKGVLIQLVSGLSNKEIADKLHISTHTVISHRKNIVLKTGIKSQSGLTIYAITKNIISL